MDDAERADRREWKRLGIWLGVTVAWTLFWHYRWGADHPFWAIGMSGLIYPIVAHFEEASFSEGLSDVIGYWFLGTLISFICILIPYLILLKFLRWDF